MDDARFVGRFDRGGDLAADVERGVDRQRASCQSFRERVAGMNSDRSRQPAG
jgi:hypothetical protein